jgi:hypothetical protein
MGSLRSLQGKKSPNRRFLEVLCAKRNKLLATIANRSAYHAAKLLAGQAHQGENYQDIRRVYQIFVLDFTLVPESGRLPRRYGFREEKEQDLLTDSRLKRNSPLLNQKVPVQRQFPVQNNHERQEIPRTTRTIRATRTEENSGTKMRAIEANVRVCSRGRG